MDFEPIPFDMVAGIVRWLLVIGVLTAIALFTGFVVSVITMGKRGVSFFVKQTLSVFGEIGSLSPMRIGAITSLAIKESLRRKALWIFAVFALLFMFAGWFLGSSEYTSAKPYVAFVLMVVKFLTLPLAVMLACWGLPADIKARSLHTVVTKPVRRTEVVLGRMFGYSIVTGCVVLVMGTIGAIWIVRQVPPRAQDQLISRVPIYAEDMSFIDRFGSEAAGGVNVGDVWEYRSFVEGATKAQATFEFRDLDIDQLRDTILAQDEEDQVLRLEYSFEVFRSYKGDVGEDVLKNKASRAIGVQAQLGLHNPNDPSSQPSVPLVRYPDLPFEVEEFKEGSDESLIEIPLNLVSVDAAGQRVEYNLFDDIAFDADGDGVKDAIDISVRCIDRQQYLGVARLDMFIRMPDRPFLTGYSKAIGGVMLIAFLLIVLGTTASTFVKGPVATLVTVGLFLLGDGSVRGFSDQLIEQFIEDEKVVGGGMLESLIRLVTQQSQAVPLDDSTATGIIQSIDYVLLKSLVLVFDTIPDLRPFDMSPYVSRGFDVPFEATFLPSVFTVIAFFIPCVILGYYSLQLRELEAK